MRQEACSLVFEFKPHIIFGNYSSTEKLFQVKIFKALPLKTFQSFDVLCGSRKDQSLQTTTSSSSKTENDIMTSQNDNLTKSCSIGTNFFWLIGLVGVFRVLLEKKPFTAYYAIVSFRHRVINSNS